MSSQFTIKPRIIIHGGAGNVTPDNLPPERQAAYQESLTSILSSASAILANDVNATALDVATHAVSLLENNPLFNAGKGAVFTRAGTVELEASIMVSKGYHKRGVGLMKLTHVKNPIKLAREMLVRGELPDGGGAGAHCQLAGESVEALAREWGLDMVETKYFYTKRRWEEHKKGLKKLGEGMSEAHTERERDYLFDTNEPGWDGKEYLPQGTVGAVVLDRFGTLCVATSTGGLTNKLPGRIGDTPTIGAGFWAEEWFDEKKPPQMVYRQQAPVARSPLDKLSRGDLGGLFADCLPSPAESSSTTEELSEKSKQPSVRRHAVAMSGTGNGDSFLRVNAVRTAAAISRFSHSRVPLGASVSRVAGPGGELQLSAADRWGKTGEGEGGIIGIELVGNEGKVVYDFNCGGMFRAWLDDEGVGRFQVFREG